MGKAVITSSSYQKKSNIRIEPARPFHHYKMDDLFARPQVARKTPSCPAGCQQYQVSAGENIDIIIKRFNTTPDRLKNSNPHITNFNALIPGDTLCVPLPEKSRGPQWPPWPV